jgi:hypothetical protein
MAAAQALPPPLPGASPAPACPGQRGGSSRPPRILHMKGSLRLQSASAQPDAWPYDWLRLPAPHVSVPARLLGSLKLRPPAM